VSAVTEQGYGGDRFPATPPERPSVKVGATPSEATVRPRPRGLDVSYGLWLVACVLGVITAAATLIYFSQLQNDILSLVERQFPDENPVTRDSVATAAVSLFIGSGVVIVLIQLGLAIAMRSGRGWTRFPLAFFTFLGVLYTAVMFDPAPDITKVGLAVTILLMLAATVPMFLRSARDWFEHRSLFRSADDTGLEW
jgi:hypothetical protein